MEQSSIEHVLSFILIDQLDAHFKLSLVEGIDDGQKWIIFPLRECLLQMNLRILCSLSFFFKIPENKGDVALS